MQLSIRSNKIKKLGNLFNLYGGTTPSTSKKEYWNGDILWVTPTDITNLNNYSVLCDTAKKVTDKAVVDNSLKLLKPGTLLLSTRASIGWTIIIDKEVTINQGITALIPKNENEIYPLFYYYYFRFIRNLLNSLASGSTFKEISKSTLKNLQIPLPPLPTQKKIAEILSTADQAIQKVDEAIEKTQRLKKGVMQRLLTKGIGHTEFKETEIGRIPKEWEVVNLENVCEQRKESVNPNKDDMNGVFIGLEHIESGENKIINYGSTENLKSTKFKFYKGDILYGKLRPYLDKAAIADIEGVCSTDIISIMQKNKKSINSFMIHIFHSERFISNAIANTTGTNHPRTSWKSISKFKFGLPSYDEQIKIADVLSNIENKLTLLRTKKQKLQRIKQGLMNELLTGKKVNSK